VRSILVVDDEFGIAEVLEALLADAGYRVTRAINGRQAMERLHESSFDVMLLDMMMPLMDGPETLRTIRRHERHAALPVVLMSGLSRDQVEARVSDAYQGYLQKPFLAQALLAELDRALGAG
jgi:CheY-like chemotaxis protein